MANINVYFNFLWNTLEVFEFYKSVFGWEFTSFQRFCDVPNLPWVEKMSEQEKTWMMHISLPILWNTVLMWTDAVESFWHKIVIWNHIYLSLNVDSKEEAEKYFNLLSQNWKIEMPLNDTFWWAYFGMCADKFWTNWMINYEYKK